MEKYQTFWKRFFAALIDGIVLYPLSLIDIAANNSSNQFLFGIGIFVSSFLYIFYFIILHAKYGQTLGKKLMNIKVVDVAEVELIGFKRAMTRESPLLIATVAIFLYLFVSLFLLKNIKLTTAKEKYYDLSFLSSFGWLITELISMFLNPKKRAINDLLAKDVVVKI